MSKKKHKKQKEIRERKAGFNYRLLVRLAASFVVIFGTYVFLIKLAEKNGSLLLQEITLWAYLILTTVVGSLFIIWNRGVSRDIPTPRDLPADWSDAKKEEFIEKYIASKAKAKKLLIILIPLLLTFFIDIINVFFFG